MSNFLQKEDFPKEWENLFSLAEPELNLISKILTRQDKLGGVYPKDTKEIFRIFHDINPEDIKVVIFGSQPTVGIVNYAFASKEIANSPVKCLFDKVFKELQVPPQTLDYTLSCWVKQGVCLVNTALTRPLKQDMKSHHGIWLGFINKFIEFIELANPEVVFVCMGADLANYKCSRNFTRIVCSAPGMRGWRDLQSFDDVKIFSLINEKISTKIQW